jgi:uncharacterized membrane protein
MSDSKQGKMRPGRLESFSDAVLAIIITIMVLELHAPEGATLDALGEAVPTLLAYVISFSIIATYWNNHHHLLQRAHHTSSATMWANLFFLFWVSLIPFFTQWMGEFHDHSLPAACYAALLAICSVAYGFLQRTIVKNDSDSELEKRIGSNMKGLLTRALYVIAIPLAFISPWLSYAIFAIVAAWWFAPDKRLIDRGSASINP